MVSLVSFSLRQAHKRVERLGDRLVEVEKLVDWERFRPIIAKLYADDPKLGGRPHTDEVVLAKCLVLQSCYNLNVTFNLFCYTELQHAKTWKSTRKLFQAFLLRKP